MMDNFILHIELGNDGMSERGDVMEALREVADKIGSKHSDDSGGIMDVNGNTVGNWSFS
jgi:hypothetical protein